MRSLLLVELAIADGRKSNLPPRTALPKNQTPLYMLEAGGYIVFVSREVEQAAALITKVDALVLHMPMDLVRATGQRLTGRKDVPLFWWCSASSAADSVSYCEDNMAIDGFLTSSMREQELHWGLHFGERKFMERQQWRSEKQQLESRLEERKWIDMAKGILCKLKAISEAEAYELLRKQAMNERKRMVDVAISIVKVHQILQNQ